MSRWYDPFGVASEVYHKVTGAPTAQERRSAAGAINEQVKAYKEQSEITRNEINAKKDQQVAEKRRVEEKQIRSLRRNYRAPGFLGAQESGEPGMTSKLGG